MRRRRTRRGASRRRCRSRRGIWNWTSARSRPGALRKIAFGNANGLEHGDNLRALLLKPWRQQEAGAELVRGFIARESAFRGGRALHQNPARATAVDRMKI